MYSTSLFVAANIVLLCGEFEFYLRDSLSLHAMSTEKGTMSICVISFSRKKVEWPLWSEKVLSKARQLGYKKILLGKETIPKDSDNIIKNKDGTNASKIEAKKRQILWDLNEEAYKKLLWMIDHRQEQGQIAFTLITGSKDKGYADGNAREAWK